MIGGYIFTFGFYDFKPVSNCNLATADANAYTGISTGILALNDGTYAQCKTQMATFFAQIDLNNDGLIDRCEDAKFLYAGVGNTADYSLNYGAYGSLSEL